ncbi:unnamed protein product, partial [Discosporangium mesarthrocarpum]
MVIIDDVSRYANISLLKMKSDAVRALRRWYKSTAIPAGVKVDFVRHDPGGEFQGGAFEELLQEMGARNEETNTGTPQQNGVAERRLAIIDEGAPASLYSAGLDRKLWLWGEAYNMAMYILNRTATASNNGKSPYLRLYGEVDPMYNIPPFGTLGFYQADPAHKLTPRGRECIMLGMATDKPRGTFRVLDITTNQDVLDPMEDQEHHESGVGTEGDTGASRWRRRMTGPTPSHPLQHRRRREGDQGGGGSQDSGTVNSGSNNHIVNDRKTGEDSEDPRMAGNPREMRKISDYLGGGSGNNLLPTRTRSGATRIDDEGRLIRAMPKEPISISEACASPERSLWENAMSDEIAGLLQNNVWTAPVKPLVIDTKWVLKRKVNQFGEVVRYKARLVAKGFSQIQGLDYHDVFAPTPSPAVLRMTFALAASKNWELKHWDVKQAFTQADVEADIYVRLCDGCGDLSGKVVKLPKSLYGCRQSGRNFNILLVQVLSECGFELCEADTCVLRLVVDGEVCAIMETHVDDLLIAGYLVLLLVIKSRIQKSIEIEDLGDLKYYMGCEVHRDRAASTLTISQTGYVKEVCKRFNVEGAQKLTPYVPSRRLDGHGEDDACAENTPYREAVGSWMWGSLMTRIDIASMVREVAMYCEEPKRVHWRTVLSVLGYLSTFPERGITCGGPDAVYELSAYADASYGLYIGNRRSVTGGVVMFYSGAISWMSKTERVVAKSTTESEYIALSAVGQEILFLGNVWEFIQPSLPRHQVITFEDNDGAEKLAHNLISASRSRTKHIDIRHHFLRNLQRNREINVCRVGTADQHADPLTK